MYLDNVITFGRTFQEHLLNLNMVFYRFQEDRLNLNPKKSQLFEKKVRYLEHTVSPEEITTDTETLRAVWE
jgi:hypothetical protein